MSFPKDWKVSPLTTAYVLNKPSSKTENFISEEITIQHQGNLARREFRKAVTQDTKAGPAPESYMSSFFIGTREAQASKKALEPPCREWPVLTEEEVCARFFCTCLPSISPTILQALPNSWFVLMSLAKCSQINGCFRELEGCKSIRVHD